MNKKVVFLVILMLVIVLCYFVIINKIIFSNKLNIKNPSNNSDIEKQDVNKEDNNNEEEDKKRIATKSVLDVIERETRKNISNFDFSLAERNMANKITNYDIDNSPDFESLKEMYFDLPIMAQFENLKKYEQYEQIKNLIKNIKDSENFFVSVMWLDMKERENFIYMDDSINPVFDGTIEIINKNIVKQTERDVLDRVNVRFSNIKEIIEIEFKIEDNYLIAYIVKLEDELKFYKIIEKIEGSTHYITIEEWERIYRRIERNKTTAQEE